MDDGSEETYLNCTFGKCEECQMSAKYSFGQGQGRGQGQGQGQVTYYRLQVTCYMLHVTCDMLQVTDYHTLLPLRSNGFS